MAEYQKGTPRAKTILNDYMQPHPETEQPVQGAKHNGALRFEQKANGRIVLRVYDNVWSDQKKTTREVELDYNERGTLFEAVRQASDEKCSFASVNIPINQRGWMRTATGNKLTDDPINMCNLIVSREPDGRVSLEYVKADFRFKVLFRLKNCASWKIKTVTGEIKDDAGLPSRASARTWCNFHETLLNDMERAVWTPRVTNAGGAGGQGGAGGGQQWQPRNNGGAANAGNGASKPVEEAFDEIDW